MTSNRKTDELLIKEFQNGNRSSYTELVNSPYFPKEKEEFWWVVVGNTKTNKLYGANIPIAALGTFILWLGWFGFNGGSALGIHNAEKANQVAQIFLNTNAMIATGLLLLL